MFIENTEELAQNKLILLYIINKSKTPLTNEEISEFVIEKNYINYFLIQQYLLELIKSGFVKYINKENDKKHILTDKGKAILSYFGDRISDKVQKEISNKFHDIEEIVKKRTQITGEYFKTDSEEYIVNLKLIENNKTLLNLSLTVATMGQAKIICNVWEKNTEYIYKTLFNILTDDIITSIDN